MTVLLYVIFGGTAAMASLTRLLLVNPRALTDLVWAEDGLFPLCVTQHGYIECLVDPFAGYFLFLSRTLAVPVSWFPLDWWPLVTNLVAALAVGTGSALIAWGVRRSGWSTSMALLVGLVPVVIPIAGFEAINAAGSAYMILLIAASVFVTLPASKTIPIWVTPIILFISALTIPSTVVLIVPLVFSFVVFDRNRWRLLLGVVAIVAGLIVQLLVVATAENPRSIAVNAESLSGWVNALPSAVQTLWSTDIGLGPTGVLEGGWVFAAPVAWIALVAIVVVSGVLVWRGVNVRDEQRAGVGMFVLTGLALGAVPALAGFANNRYFVIPVTLIAMAAVMLIGLIPVRRMLPVTIVVAVGLAFLWRPGFPAAEARAAASPPWPQMLEAIELECEGGAENVAVTFSPNWPFVDAIFPGPTSPVVSCDELQRMLK